MYKGKYRHIHSKHNIIWQLLSTKIISFDYVKSKDNITNSLIKELNQKLIQKSSNGMRLKRIKESRFTKET